MLELFPFQEYPSLWYGSKFSIIYSILFYLNFAFYVLVSQTTWWNGKQCRPWSDFSGAVWSRSALFACAILLETLVYEI